MKFLNLIIILNIVFYSTLAFGNEANNSESYAWGEVVKTDKLSRSGFKYFVLFNDGKSEVAYPLMPTKAIPLESIEQYVGLMARIKGNVKTQKIDNSEFKKEILIFLVTSIETLKLNELGINKLNMDKQNEFKVKPEEQLIKMTSKNSGSVIIRNVDDTVTNTLIFAGGSYILGRIIYEVVKGK